MKKKLEIYNYIKSNYSAKNLKKYVSKGSTLHYWTNIMKREDMKKKLKELQHININYNSGNEISDTQYFMQRTSPINNTHDFFNEDVAYFNENINYLLQHWKKTINNNNEFFIMVKLKIAMYKSYSIGGNPYFLPEVSINNKLYIERMKSKISYMKEDFRDENEIDIDRRLFISHRTTLLETEKVNKLFSYVKNEEESGIIWVFEGVNLFITKRGQDKQFNLNEYATELKAFSPTSNQQYHKQCQVSTTKNRYCIYETYLFIEKNIIPKRTKNIKELINNEPKEVINYIKNGELINFLIYKSKEHNKPYYIEIYKHDPINGLMINKDEITEIINLKEFNNKQVFLYDDNHVAPRRLNLEIKKSNKNKNLNYSMKPLKVKCINDNIESVLAFDFETYNNEKHEEIPYCVCMSNGKSFYGINVVNEFCDYIDSIATKLYMSKTNSKLKVKQIFIYGFNNSRFDNQFILNGLLKRNRNMKYIISNNDIKYMKYYNIRFYDIAQYYSGSLDQVSKSFNLLIKKGVFPYSFVNKDNLYYNNEVPELKYWNSNNDRTTYIKENGKNFNLKEYTIKYCLLDTELTKQIADIHLKECVGTINNKLYDARNSITAAGISLKVFNQCFQNDIIYQSPKDIQTKERTAYKGGRTEAFKEFFEYEDAYLKYIDLNSSYPSSMLETMPYNYLQTFNQTILNAKIEDITPYYLYYCNSSYNGDNEFFIPNLLTRSKKGDIIAVKNTDYDYHWGIEVIEAIKSNCIINIKEIIVYSSKPLFNEFSNYFYNERLKEKKLNHTSKIQFYKILLNSLYGKFGQKEKEGLKICKSLYDINKILTDEDLKITNFKLIGNDIALSYKNKEEEHCGFIRLSSYIAAYSRTKLSNMMREVGYENIYYCDTDSIFTSKEIPEKYISDTELGLWKYESKTIIKAVFLAPKLYYYKEEDKQENSIIHAKGQPKKLMKTEYLDLAYDNKDVKITNPTMFKRSLDKIIKEAQIRTLRKVQNKRIWKGNNSYAFNNYSEWFNNKYN